MSQTNGGGPTPARRIRDLMTTTVVLPRLSERAGAPVAVRIRMLSRQEWREIKDPLPTTKMTLEEMHRYLKALDGPQRTEYQRQADDADEQLILAAVVAPEVKEGGDPETTIPLAALWPDRIGLITDILRFSGFLGEPWEPAADRLAGEQASKLASSEAAGLPPCQSASEGAPAPFRPDASGGPVGDPPGGGGALPPAGNVAVEGDAD